MATGDSAVNPPSDRLNEIEQQHARTMSSMLAEFENTQGEWLVREAKLNQQNAILSQTLKARESAASRQVEALTRARSENRILRDQRDAQQAQVRVDRTVIEMAYDHALRGMSACRHCSTSVALLQTALEPFERLSEVEPMT